MEITKNTISCLSGCSPINLVNLNLAINDLTGLEIFNNCDEPYNKNLFNYSYSVDGVCWSCYMTYDDILKNTINISSDFYVRFKMPGSVKSIQYNGEAYSDFTSQLAEGFNFEFQNKVPNSNTFNPYANLDCAIALQQQLSETVSNMFGIPIYYFKLSPNASSKDITFKEYTLMDVEAVKQIKLIIRDGEMPSSKPEFSDFGLDFDIEWETEISKTTFATAFGNNAQPMEGDLIYIPMMKRMWMVNGSYDEKKDSLMWCSTTFNLQLVKYQEKGSVNLGETEDLVNSFVKNKYDDLFGDEEPLDSGFEALTAPKNTDNNLYPVFESDSTRKYVSCDTIDLNNVQIYYKGALVADMKYDMTNKDATVVYQRQYCGNEMSCSFIFSPSIATFEGTLINFGTIALNVKQEKLTTTLYLNIKDDVQITVESNKTYFVTLRWSAQLNNVDLMCYEYTWNKKIPQYKLQNQHYLFDINNPTQQKVSSYDIEFDTPAKVNVEIHNLVGWITNIKVFDVYNDNISELLQMYPNHQHLIINDTVRRLVDDFGVALR